MTDRPSADSNLGRPHGPLHLLLVGFVFTAGALVVHARILGGSFLADDWFLIRNALAGRAFMLPIEGFFRPVAAIALWLEARCWGLHPAGFHVTNAVLHAIAALALYRIGWRLGLGVGGLAGALFFLVAPAHSEAVAWISGRMDLQAAALGLLGVWAWVAAEARAGRYAVAVALLVAALLTKESAAPLLLVLIAWELWRGRRSRALALLALLCAYLVARRVALGTWIGGYGGQVHSDLDPIRVLENLVVFALRSFSGALPHGWLADDRPLWGLWHQFVPSLPAHPRRMVAVAAIVLLGAWGALRSWRRVVSGDGQRLGFLVVAYVMLLLPVANLRVSIVTVEAERFLYLPSAPLFLLAAGLLCRVVRSGPVRVGMAIAAMLALAGAQQRALTAWCDASELTTQLLPQIATAARSGPITLVNLPDNIRGAYVFRTGLPDALMLTQPGTPWTYPVVLHSVMSIDEVVRVRADGESLELALGDPRSSIRSVALPSSSIVTRLAGAIRFEEASGARRWAYSAGTLQTR